MFLDGLNGKNYRGRQLVSCIVLSVPKVGSTNDANLLYDSNSVLTVGPAKYHTPIDDNWYMVATIGCVITGGNFLLQFAYADSAPDFKLYTRKGDNTTLTWSSWKQIQFT
jgi:hypothetical protein